MAEAGNNSLPEQNFEVPAEDQQAELAHTEATEQTPVVETVGKGQESAAGKQVQVHAQPQMPVPVSNDQTAVQTQHTAPTDDPLVKDLVAKDADLIEKQWVERAKSIIAKTADDPHKQKHEVSKMKAAYIQKRFNKAIKTDEATA